MCWEHLGHSQRCHLVISCRRTSSVVCLNVSYELFALDHTGVVNLFGFPWSGFVMLVQDEGSHPPRLFQISNASGSVSAEEIEDFVQASSRHVKDEREGEREGKREREREGEREREYRKSFDKHILFHSLSGFTSRLCIYAWTHMSLEERWNNKNKYTVEKKNFVLRLLRCQFARNVLSTVYSLIWYMTLGLWSMLFWMSLCVYVVYVYVFCGLFVWVYGCAHLCTYTYSLQNDLIPEDVMLLDCWDCLYLWVGQQSNKIEREQARTLTLVSEEGEESGPWSVV